MGSVVFEKSGRGYVSGRKRCAQTVANLKRSKWRAIDGLRSFATLRMTSALRAKVFKVPLVNIDVRLFVEKGDSPCEAFSAAGIVSDRFRSTGGRGSFRGPQSRGCTTE